jgi:hypothetical protein
MTILVIGLGIALALTWWGFHADAKDRRIDR